MEVCLEVGYVHLLLGAVSCRGQKVAFDLLELELKAILNSGSTESAHNQ